MKAVFARGCTLLLAASLAGCAAGGGGRAQSGADVTRFHLGQPIARAQIAVEAVDKADANSLEFRSYAEAVARRLSALGWTVVPGGSASEQVALVDVQQGSREALAQRSPVSIGVGVGGGTGGWRGGGVGVGGGVSFGVGGGGRSGELVSTLLEVRIKRRSEGTVFWEGRATTEARAGSPESERTVAVEKLADALFRDFPGESGRTIRVR